MNAMTYEPIPRTRAGIRLAAALAIVVGSGCGDNFEGPAKEGELGVGAFFYGCVGDSDFYCDDGGQAEGFPEAIAVGGRFTLDYNQDNDGVLPKTVPGSDSISVDGAGLVIIRAGWSVVLASQGDGDIIDLLHLSGRNVERIALFVGDSQELAEIELEPGERVVLVGRPQDSNRTTLAGSLNYEWRSDDDAVFRIASADLDESVEIEGVAAGTTMLAVTAGSFTQMVSVTVGGDASTTGGESTGETTGDPTRSDESESDDGDSGTGGESESGTSDGDGSDEGSGGSTDGGTTTGGA